MTDAPVRRKDVPLAYTWVLNHPEFWPLYENPLYTRDALRGTQVHCRYNDTTLMELLTWCMENCQGRFTHFSDPEIEGPLGQAFYFENPDDATRFKLTLA